MNRSWRVTSLYSIWKQPHTVHTAVENLTLSLYKMCVSIYIRLHLSAIWIREVMKKKAVSNTSTSSLSLLLPLCFNLSWAGVCRAKGAVFFIHRSLDFLFETLRGREFLIRFLVDSWCEAFTDKGLIISLIFHAGKVYRPHDYRSAVHRPWSRWAVRHTAQQLTSIYERWKVSPNYCYIYKLV